MLKNWDKETEHDPTDLPVFDYDDYNKIEYYYVTLDCHNAIESSPSEINAWESYNYDGLYTRVSASEALQITIHDGAKSTATGDVIGFRVYAVNYDGTLADPDGKAFYVYVGDNKSTEDLGAATITATDTLTLAGGKAADKVDLTDKVIEVEISKVGIAGEGTSELAGAKLTLTLVEAKNKGEDLSAVEVTPGEGAEIGRAHV